MFERYKEMEQEQIGSERGRKKGGGRMEREKRGEKKKEKEMGCVLTIQPAIIKYTNHTV